MTKNVALAALLALGLSGCEDDLIIVEVDPPAAPRNVDAFYYAGAVTVTWELAPAWNGEPFRVYSKRVTDADFFLIAEVTSCAADLCEYKDVNVAAGETYRYFVAAVDPDTGAEASSDFSVDVLVPEPTAPPVPGQPRVIALDDANYFTWDDAARAAEDFAFYRVYLAAEDGTDILLGETDSEGFLDLLASNGSTSTYFVASVDTYGHVSAASALAAGTPRPDFHGEWLYNHFDRPELSGFRFQADEDTDPLVSGDSSSRHFRLEVDASGSWIVPGPQTVIYPIGFATTALKCGVAADATCVDLPVAPPSGYVFQDVPLASQTSYVMRVRGDDGQDHYGVIRVELLGLDQDDDAIMIFDWAYQIQANNPNVVPPRGP